MYTLLDLSKSNHGSEGFISRCQLAAWRWFLIVACDVGEVVQVSETCLFGFALGVWPSIRAQLPLAFGKMANLVVCMLAVGIVGGLIDPRFVLGLNSRLFREI
jgi:hypothetical protein